MNLGVVQSRSPYEAAMLQNCCLLYVHTSYDEKSNVHTFPQVELNAVFCRRVLCC